MQVYRMSIPTVVRNLTLSGLLIVALGSIGEANAAQGCGFGYHQSFRGGCVLNYPGPYASPAPYHPGCWRNRWGQLRCFRY